MHGSRRPTRGGQGRLGAAPAWRRWAAGAALAALVLSPGVTGAGSVPVPGQPLDDRALDDLQQDVARFESQNRDFRGTVRHIVQQQYTEKRKALMGKYQASIDKEERDEKTRRLKAIELFERFLSRYSSDDRWTPDAMFRLAELYFERASEEYLVASQSQSNSTGQVTPDYAKTIEIYRDLINRFPSYRLVDGAYYLMAYCLGEMTRERESLQVMRSLVCANKHRPLDEPAPPTPTKGRMSGKLDDPYADCEPVKKDSRFLPEAWTRVGETHFDNNELELAIAAYGRVLKFTESSYFDKALYKQAWSFYRADNYPEAVKRFDDLVIFSDKKKAETGGEGVELRPEAVQYLGVSFAERDWDGDGADDAEGGLARLEKFYQGREGESHVREIFAKLGDIYFDQTEYFKAITVYKRALEKWPFDPGNPKLQDRIVMAFERQRDFNNALKERESLARNYVKGTDWYKKNRDNKEAVDQAAELAELALIQAAINHHKAAQDLKKMAQTQVRPDGKLIEQVSTEYAMAASSYEKYLEQYPNSKLTYEYSYSYAETLYYSGRFLESAAAYEKVRDSNLDNKYAEDAAFNAIKSYEKYIDSMTANGTYKEPPLPAVGKTTAPVTPLEMPVPVQKLQKSLEVFTQRVPKSGRVPTMEYKVAEMDYRFLKWDAARPRFEQIINKYCKDDMGANAGNALIVSYTVENNLDKLGEWTEKLKTMNCGSSAVAQKNAADLTKLSLNVKFKKADLYFEQGKFEEAAKLYVQIVDADPKAEDADKALNNAAVAYEKVNRFAAATRLYERIVTDYPTSKFVDDALFRTAVSYQKGFEFDKAVVSYLRLAEDPRFASSTHRTDSLFNAAVLEENDQNYAKAAELFRRYAADSNVKREEASEAFFRIAINYQKLKDANRTIAALKDYIRLYGSDAKGSQKVAEANFRMAEAFELQKNRKAADEQYARLAAMTGVAPTSEQAEHVAHAAFILAEAKLKEFEKSKLLGGKDFAASSKKLVADAKKMADEYDRILKYARATWSLGSYFRKGYIYEFVSKSMASLVATPQPCPKELKKLGQEACDLFAQKLQDEIEKEIQPIDEKVIQLYGDTLMQAGKLGVSNEFTKLARVRANSYNPQKFPMVKDERIEIQLESP